MKATRAASNGAVAEPENEDGDATSAAGASISNGALTALTVARNCRCCHGESGKRRFGTEVKLKKGEINSQAKTGPQWWVV